MNPAGLGPIFLAKKIKAQPADIHHHDALHVLQEPGLSWAHGKATSKIHQVFLAIDPNRLAERDARVKSSEGLSGGEDVLPIAGNREGYSIKQNEVQRRLRADRSRGTTMNLGYLIGCGERSPQAALVGVDFCEHEELITQWR